MLKLVVNGVGKYLLLTSFGGVTYVKYYKPSMFSRLIAFLSSRTLRLHAA